MTTIISDLPAELVTRIAEQTLQAYKERAGELRTIHDRDPMRVVELLRSFMREPALRYFVRTFEVWALRTKPEDWTWDVLGFGSREWKDGQPHEADHDYSGAIGDQNLFSPEELTDYRVFLQEHLGFATAFASRCIDRILQGDDQPLKTMLMALCPRLNTILFVNNTQYTSSELLDHTFRILYQRHEHRQPWHSFQNLQRVITGVAHPAISTHGSGDDISWSETAPLFLLPSIQSLTFDNKSLNYVGEIYYWEWAPRISNVRELVFHGNAEGDAATFDSLMSAVKALRAIRGFEWGIEKHEFIDSLAAHQSHSLEELSLYGFWPKRGWSDDEMADMTKMTKLKELTSLRTIQLAVDMLISGAGSILSTDQRDDWMRDNPDPAVMARLTDLLPRSIENVLLSGRIDLSFPAVSRSYFQMLNGLVSSKIDGGHMSLSHICIAGVRPTAFLDERSVRQAQSSGTGELTALREHCEANGVVLHGWDAISYRKRQPCPLYTDRVVVELSPVLGYDI
ncbi:hypothetical protein LTR66_004504 [Elasticomyces elasticus]|nr:hypothetical protein LTR66_004504 [Elasticomyces elasticus]